MTNGTECKAKGRHRHVVRTSRKRYGLARRSGGVADRKHQRAARALPATYEGSSLETWPHPYGGPTPQAARLSSVQGFRSVLKADRTARATKMNAQINSEVRGLNN